ncbi:hypothetical protein ABVT39_028188 [Epinephelus coioides]
MHVASVNETFLSPHIDFSLPGYDIIRSDRPQGKGGGVALLIKRPVVYHETTISLNPEQAQNNEFVTARVKLSPNSSMLLMSVYCPPGVTPSTHLFQETLLKEKTVVIMGDFNAKHSSFNNKSTNQSGIILNNIIEQFDLVLLNNDEPTHYSSSYNSVDILDLCLVTPDLTGKVIQFSVCPDIGSDHLPIITSFNLKAQAAARKLKYDYNTANWEAFKHSTTYLSNNLLPCDPEPSTIDQRTLFLGQILLTARENTINLKRVQNGLKNLPLSLIHLIKVKRKLRREFMKTRSPEIKQRVNQLQTQIRREMRKERERTWDRFYTDLNNDPNPKTFWQKIHQINEKKNNSKVSVLRNNDKIIEEEKEKANVFKEHLKNVHSCPEDPLFDPEWKEIVERQVSLPTHLPITTNTDTNNPLIKAVTITKLQEHLKKLKVKAPGEDGVDNRLIKESATEYLAQLADLFTICLHTGYFPKPWKSALVTMIPKPHKDPHLAANYRPISLLSTLGKLLERVLADRLQRHFDALGVLGVHQARFRRERSTTDNILRLAEDVQRGFNKKEVTIGVFFDIEKAFDKMWHDGLVYRLLDQNLKLPQQMVVLLNSFLNDRKIAVKVGTSVSSRFSPEAGVPQGSALSPLLFLLYICDIYYPPRGKGQVSQFADDLCYWASVKNIKYAAKKLQVCITEMEGWANMWRVKLNPTKTQCVIFTRHPCKNHQINLTLKLYGRTLQVTPTAKCTFRQNMQWTAHIADMENEARRRLNHLKLLCRKEGGANPETASRVYQSYIRPLFEYAAPAWCNVGAAQLKKLQTIQNIAIKMCYRIPKYTSNKYTHLLSGFMTLQERMVYLGKKYLHRAETNPSLQPVIEEERTNPPRFICTTPLSVLLKHNIETQHNHNTF